MTTRRQVLERIGATVAASLLAPRLAQADPLEQVRLYYGFPAGSSGDTVTRRVGERFVGTAYSRNGAVVENKVGAGGRIALDALKAAPADGSVMTLSPVSCLSIYPLIYPTLGYQPRDFVPVSMAAITHHGLAIGPMVPASVRTVREFLAWCKANPGQAAYGSPGAGSEPHFLGALLGLNSGTDLRHVPYRGSVPGVTDVVGGQVAAMITPHGDFITNHKAGRLRIIATTGPKRSPFVPDVATFAEQGFPELTTEEWFGFYAPARTPQPVLAAANQAIAAALNDRAVIESLNVVGLIPRATSLAETAAALQADMEYWAPHVKRVGFTGES
jgi:tripartite-type tricarboxylate transporter receptor subunit TctC